MHIGEVGCAYDLPTEEDAGQARRGIIIWFSLLDNSRRPTRADGEVTVKISTGDNLFSDFKKSIQVRKEDFRQSTNKKNFYGYWFNTEKAVLTEQKPPYQMRRIELWFKTAPGKKLYGKGDAPF